MLIDLLRAHTRQLHDQIEAQWFSELILNDPPIDFYASYLVGWLKIYKGFDQAVGAYQLVGWSDAFARAQKNLMLDLEGLEKKTADQNQARFFLPVCDALSAWGALYVIYGSGLGGTVIAKRLKKSASSAIYGNARFLIGNGKNTMESWKSFLDELSGLNQCSGDQHQAVVEGAKKSFSAISSFLADFLETHRSSSRIVDYAPP